MMDLTNLTPPKQAILVFAAGLSIMGGALLLDKTGLMEMDRLFPWTVATGLLLFFGLFNSLSSLQSDSFAKYWGISMYSYIGLAAAFGMAAWLLSGVPIGEAESYKFIYLVVTFGFLVFLSMVNLMKNIVNFAEREEWSQPRRKK